MKNEHDKYVDVAMEQFDDIINLYKEFEDKKPIMLYDIQEQKIYAYPYIEFNAELSERSQGMLEKQYKKALVDNKVVIFVEDNVKKKLVSFSVGFEENL